jgi:hypothetical protein
MFNRVQENLTAELMEKKTRGGKRAGAGRPKGSLRGRKVVAKTITLPVETWARIDAERGTMSRGKFLEVKL